MSYTEIYTFNKEGYAKKSFEIFNSHLGAYAIWKYLEKKYLKPLKYSRMILNNKMQDIWDLRNSDEVTNNDKILLISTFDDVVVLKEDFSKIINAYNNTNFKSNLKEQSDFLIKCLDEENVIAISWNQNSIGESKWDKFNLNRLLLNLEDDDLRDSFEDYYLEYFDVELNYNLKDKSGIHWLLFEKQLKYEDLIKYFKDEDDIYYFSLFIKNLKNIYKNEKTINFNINIFNNLEEIVTTEKIDSYKEEDKKELRNLYYFRKEFENILTKLDEKYFMYRSCGNYKIRI